MAGVPPVLSPDIRSAAALCGRLRKYGHPGDFRGHHNHADHRRAVIVLTDPSASSDDFLAEPDRRRLGDRIARIERGEPVDV